MMDPNPGSGAAIALRPLAPRIGVELLGVDLAQPMDDRKFAAIRAAWLLHTILLVRDQAHLRPEDLIAFARRFGELDEHDQPQYCLPAYPAIAIVSNVKEGGRYIGAPKAGRQWHSDAQYLRKPPSASLLWAKEVPPADGNTCFANMIAAYEGLDADVRARLRGLRINFSRVQAYARYHPERPPLGDDEKARLPDVQHPIERKHPETGMHALYVGGEQHGGTVIGLPGEEGDALMRGLREFATQPDFVYEHRWRAGDLIVWDNRSTMHCALPFDEDRYRRIMYRVQVAGDEPRGVHG
ncbi:MAG TPA: TauD/TfdA family dioxygenase [Casimicrobiaceae bacterium]|nr:TauD/TfdA family dioxygenase [Casimicrobiaceae bacterium]